MEIESVVLPFVPRFARSRPLVVLGDGEGGAAVIETLWLMQRINVVAAGARTRSFSSPPCRTMTRLSGVERDTSLCAEPHPVASAMKHDTATTPRAQRMGEIVERRRAVGRR